MLLFKLNEDELNMKKKAEKEIEKINNKLLSIYSLNIFNREEKIIISNYEQHWLEVKGLVSIAIGLNKPLFAAGGQGLFIYKKELDSDKKNRKNNK